VDQARTALRPEATPDPGPPQCRGAATGTAEIEVETSLNAFVKRIGLASKGDSIRIIKDQLAKPAAAQIRLAVAYGDDHARQVPLVARR
jgi:hypothetical protein